MRLLAILAFFSAIPPAFSQELPPSKYEWQTLRSKALTIRGMTYEAESAQRDWSILVARNARQDVTRFEVRQGDQWDQDKSSGENKERSELDGYRKRWAAGTDVWCAYSFFIEPGAAHQTDWTAISQMHGSKARPFHVHFTNNLLKIFTEHLTAASKAAITLRHQGVVSRNAWHSVVFHLREGSSDGRLEFWLDGKKIVDVTGPIGTPGNQAYWKFGIYRGYGPISTPLAIQFANMEVGNDNLAARILKPLEIP
jgi:hypothetical protein